MKNNDWTTEQSFDDSNEQSFILMKLEYNTKEIKIDKQEINN